MVAWASHSDENYNLTISLYYQLPSLALFKRNIFSIALIILIITNNLDFVAGSFLSTRIGILQTYSSLKILFTNVFHVATTVPKM
jgi:hypothetical protein